MYHNIGGKIKGLAIAWFIIETIGAFITGIILWVDWEEWWCALIVFGGPVFEWISSWLLYAFGQLVENSDVLVQQNATRRAEDERDARARIENVFAKHASNTLSSTAKRCPHCGEMTRSRKCEMCGKEITDVMLEQGEKHDAEAKARIKNFFERNAEDTSRDAVKCCPHCGAIANSGRCEMCGKEVD